MDATSSSDGQPVDRRRLIPVACTLSAVDAASQAQEWVELQGRVLGVEAVPGGAAMQLPADLADVVADLAAREASCCAFLDISHAVAGDVLTLTMTSQNPDAAPVIRALTGVG